MYNEDDAVAKLDGYVVSVSGAASLVGERTLVRIEQVGRSAAVASLVNPPDGAGSGSDSDADPEADSDSADESDGAARRRRRGRRGGRRRRKAPSESSSSN